jgi:hypothetical protein
LGNNLVDFRRHLEGPPKINLFSMAKKQVGEQLENNGIMLLKFLCCTIFGQAVGEQRGYIAKILSKPCDSS